MLEIRRIDHIHITVSRDDLEDARLFYAEVMGLEMIKRPDEALGDAGFWFLIGGVELHIGVEEIRQQTRRHSAFEVSDLDGWRDYLQDKVKISEENVIPGRRRFSFRDPFGNRLELIQYEH